MDTNTTDTVSNVNIDDERLILYAIGDLTTAEMVAIDKYAFTHPDINKKLELLLEIVDIIETSPEIQMALSNPEQMSDFLEFLVSFGKDPWSWSENEQSDLQETIKQKLLEWTQDDEAQKEREIQRCKALAGGYFTPEGTFIPPVCACGGNASSFPGYPAVAAFGTGFGSAAFAAPIVAGAAAVFPFIPPGHWAGPTDVLHQRQKLERIKRRPVSDPVPNDPDGFTAEKKNDFLVASENSFSTFGLDVDTASYTLAKEYIQNHSQLPPPESVREEEYVNYFDWELPQPEENSACPFRPTVEIGRHPLKPRMLLVKIGIQGKTVPREEVPPLNLTYLIDVSGSMNDENKLDLIKEALCRQVDFLRYEDSISIVIYRDTASVVLESTPVRDRKKIKTVINSLMAYDGTNASDGLVLAYQENQKRFNAQGINRVILCSDGDFNIGITDRDKLQSLIKQQSQSGIFLLVLGFGMGNYKDNTMEALANYGQGSYHYINNRKEAQRILEDENFGSMMTIAKDVKIQMDFNPARVQSYRLIGYENRCMQDQEFNDDTKESGNIGVGQNVVALYEIVPVGETNELEPPVDRSRYEKFHQCQQDETQNSEQTPKPTDNDPLLNELFLLKIRWKEPNSDESQFQDFPINAPTDDEKEKVSSDFRFAYAVALFAQILANGKYTAGAKFDDVLKLIPENRNEQQEEFAKLVEMAKKILNK